VEVRFKLDSELRIWLRDTCSQLRREASIPFEREY
jgi:hypothetical protein